MSKPVKYAIVRNDEPALVRLKSFRNKNDGTTDVDIEYDDVFLKLAKAELATEEITQLQMSQYIGELLAKATNGIDGYRIEVEG